MSGRSLFAPRCACGKAISKRHASQCKACREKHDEDLFAAARAIVAKGKCPFCGAPLKRNSALAGWYQCGAFGAPEFRAPGCRDLPFCAFQTFTE